VHWPRLVAVETGKVGKEWSGKRNERYYLFSAVEVCNAGI